MKWEVKTFGEVCNLVRGPFGGSLKKSFFKDSGFAVYEQQHAIQDQFTNIRYFIDQTKFEEMQRFRVHSGDLLMSCSGTMGKVALVPEGIPTGIINQALLKISPSDCISPHFLKYWMDSPNFQSEISSLSKGVAIKNVASVKVLKQIKIPVPPIAEQKRIVEILDESFAGIERAEAIARQNLTNARELFDSYLNKIFTEKGKNWIETSLNKLCNIKHGFAFKSEFFTNEENDYILLTPGSFYEAGGFRDQGQKTKYYTGEIPDGYILKKDDFLIAMTEQAVGLLGSSLLVPEDNKFLHNQRLGLVEKFQDVKWDNGFFFHQFNTKSFRDAVQLSASGVKVRHTSPTKLGMIKVSFPDSIEEQKNIAIKLNQIQEEKQKLEKIYQRKIEALGELKQSILQKAFSGQLTQ